MRALRAERLRRAERDQAARQASDAEALDRVDAENLPWLRKVITETGWPGRPIVGEDGANAAWQAALRMIGAPSLPDMHGMILEGMTGSGGSGRGQASFRSLLTLLAAYRLVFGSWRHQDGPQEATALRF